MPHLMSMHKGGDLGLWKVLNFLTSQYFIFGNLHRFLFAFWK